MNPKLSTLQDPKPLRSINIIHLPFFQQIFYNFDFNKQSPLYMSRRKLLTLLLILPITLTLQAQGSFDLITLDTKKGLGKFQIIPGSARNITNTPGYDNQPNFINNDQLVFSSQADQGGNEIIMYNYETGNFTNMTRTPDKSEFSPSLTDCGQYVSAVTVEEDSSQRLWLYPVNMGEPELLYDDIMPVGYYAWHDNIAAMYILGNPNQLIYPYSKEEKVTLSENIGRSINKRPKSNEVTFLNAGSNVVVDGQKAMEILSYDLKKRSTQNLGLSLGGSEDFIWLDKNTLLMARGKDLYVRNVKKSISWEQIASVSLPGYNGISRLAISPKKDKLVLVMERQN
ncbi:MAG TPA: hypothetical protein VKX33_00915 [Cyclobacteriaceae bacterium]|nr:hypothetical protein [Cyclobacteriaceae bacterium]